MRMYGFGERHSFFAKNKKKGKEKQTKRRRSSEKIL